MNSTVTHTFSYDYRSASDADHMYCVFDGDLSIREYEPAIINQQLANFDYKNDRLERAGVA